MARSVVWATFLLLAPAVKCESWPKEAMRAAACVVPDSLDHLTRAALLQKCISKNYGAGNETQCFPELGCFPMESPWITLTRPLPTPHHPALINVRLYCFTRASSERYNISLWPEVQLNGCPFDKEKKTVFITHGFASSGNSSWLHTFKDNMLQQVDGTVFIVDWGNGAQLHNYLQVASNTRIVGAEVARFIHYLQSYHKMRPENVHLLGHSLGAQISSYIAKRIPGIAHLTAMDPAQPCFEMEHKSVRLDESDAKFVEVIHTNGAPFIPFLGFGMIHRCGHVDYYMNGGVRQPGCILPDQSKIKSITDLGNYAVEVINNLVSCSHGRAYEYYMQVLQDNCTIWARKANFIEGIVHGVTLARAQPVLSMLEPCTSATCLPLGLDALCAPARGTFTASTSRTQPFCDDPETNKKILNEIEQSDKKQSEEEPSVLTKATQLPADAKGALYDVLSLPDKAKDSLKPPSVSVDRATKLFGRKK